MQRKFILAVILFLAVLLAANLAARRLLPHVPDCSGAIRNEYRFRGWPEYLAGLRAAPGATRLVLLSNSQGYAGEERAERSYPALLGEALNRRQAGGHTNWVVMNLSIDGVTHMEYMLLASLLRDDPPPVVLTVVGYADFRAENFDQGLAHGRTDVPRLVTRWRVLRHLPWAFYRRHFKLEEFLTASAHDHLALLRFRDYLWSWLDVRFPRLQTVFYAPNVPYRAWDIKSGATYRPLQLPMPRFPPPKFVFDDHSTTMLREYLAQLAPLTSRVFVATAPLRLAERDKRVLWQQQFQDAVTAAAAEQGMTCWDLTSALPPQDFVTSSHFNADNHHRLSELLADRIAGSLAP